MRGFFRLDLNLPADSSMRILLLRIPFHLLAYQERCAKALTERSDQRPAAWKFAFYSSDSKRWNPTSCDSPIPLMYSNKANAGGCHPQVPNPDRSAARTRLSDHSRGILMASTLMDLFQWKVSLILRVQNSTKFSAISGRSNSWPLQKPLKKVLNFRT